MGGTWFAARLQLRNDARRQYLAEFDAPLIKTVDCPHRALGKYAVFIKSHEAAEALRGERIRQNDIGGRFPSITRNGIWKVEAPSAASSSAVLPNANPSACAKRLAIRRS